MKLESTLRDNAGFLYTAPLMDVVLLLLVFFLLGSSFVLKSGVSVTVPTSEASLPPISASHVVTILPGASPELYFNEHKVTLDQLGTFLDEASPNVRHVIIRADQMAPHGLVMKVSNIVHSHGLEIAHATTQSAQIR